MNVVSVDELRGGLNKQKMILAGLFVLARSKAAKVLLPLHIVNFMPTTEGYKREPLLFSEVFDRDAFLNAVPPGMIACDSDELTEVLSWKACFESGGQALDRSDDLAVNVVTHLVASNKLQKTADQIVEWLRPFKVFALQLRIERDWQEYLVKKFGASNLIIEDQEITVDVDRIFRKCKNTQSLFDYDYIWCCCDEDDLLLSIEEIKAKGTSAGYKLYFKTDLPEHIRMPNERTKRSAIDFAVCIGLSHYVGLSRSTFSNQLFLMSENRKCIKGAKHYIYNNVGEFLLTRPLGEAGLVQNNVVIGLENQLFLFDGGQRSFAFSTALESPSARDCSSFFTNLKQRNSFLKARNIPFIHLVYPSKEIVIRDKVPAPFQERIKSLFLRCYVESNPTLEKLFRYPLDLLLERNITKPVFRALDTHMTDAGTMAVTQSVLEEWGMQYDWNRFFIVSLEKRRGDLADMLQLENKIAEEFYKPIFHFLTFDNRSALPGNTDNICIIHHPKSLTNKRLLIFGDSFIKYALPFFAPVFRDVVYVRSTTFQSDMVELMKPDFVITSNAERYLCKVAPDTISKPSIFTHYGKNGYCPPHAFVEACTAQFSWQHHRGVYEAWSRKMQTECLRWDGLGVCQPNLQIDSLDMAGSFRSTGSDPYLTFPQATISFGKRYALEFDMESDVESVAAVYFQTEADDCFSEINTVKRPVSCGSNRLLFTLPSCRLKSILRLDPLACQGNFTINNVIFKAIE